MKKVLDILDNIQEVHCTEYANEKIDEAIKELEELENRSCSNCKHWNNSCFNLSVNTTGFCMYYGISNGSFEEDMKNNFYCNKWEK